MSDNHKLQLEIEANAGDARREIASVGDAAAQMAQKVQQAGAQAGQGMDAAGKAGEQAAEKFTRAERSIASAIQRTTAEMRSLGQGGSAKFEELISIRGYDPAKFRGLIGDLRLAEQQAEALARANARTGLSAKEMAFAMRGVPAQFTDIFTSLASGQRPLTVLLQQGGQLKDMFGGVGNAAKAMGGYLVRLINPYTLLTAAAGGLAVAYYQGSKEADAYAKSLILTGNAAGTSANALAGMASQIKATGAATQGAAAEALALAAGTGKISGENIKLVADAALRMQKVAGVAVKETVDQFAELGKAPVAASLKLNETTNHLTESIFRQIKALEEQGMTVEAAALAQKAYADALTSRAGEIEQNLGYIEKLWKGVASEAKSAWDAMLGVGRKQTLQDRIKELETAQGRGFFTAHRTTEQDAELAALKAQAKAIDDAAVAKARANEQEKAGINLLQEREKYLSKEEQKQRELLKLTAQYEKSAQTGQNQKDYLAAVAGVMDKFAEKTKEAKAGIKAVKDEYAELMNKLTAQDSGLSSSFWKDLDTLHKQYLKTGDIDAYRRAVELLVTQQKFHQDAVKASAAADAEWAKAANNAQGEREKEIASIEKKAQAAEDEIRYYGLAKSEIEALIIARLEERRAIEAGIDGQEDVVARLDREIKARRSLRDSYLSREILDANKKAAAESAKAWENFSRDIEQSLTDALMRGFESGESFGENFVKTLQNTLKTAALKLAVQVVMQPVMGSLGQALGYTQGGAGGGGLGNIFSLANNFTGGGGMYGNFATSAAGQSLGLSALVPGIFEEAAALGVGGAVGGGGAALTGLGTALPYIGIGLGLLSLFGGDLFGGKEKPPVAAWTQFPQGSKDWGIPLATPWGDLRFAGQHMGDTEAEVAKLRDAFAPIAQRDYAISGLLTGEENKRIEQAIAGYTTGEMEDYSEAAMRAHFEKRLDLVSDAIGGWVDEIADAFSGSLEDSYTAIATLLSVRGVEGAEELARAFIGTFETAAGEAIVQAQSGTFMDGFINDLNAGGGGDTVVSALSRDGESLADTFTRLISDLVAVRDAFDLMGRAALDFTLDAAVMATDIADAFGGREAFGQQFAAYYQEFYSEAERLAAHTENVAEAFGDLGLSMPDTHDAFRAIIDGLDLTTEAGQELFAGLLKLAPAFDIVADAAAAQAATMRGLSIQWAEAYGRADWSKEMRRQDVRASITDQDQLDLQNAVWRRQDMAERRELEIQLMEAQGNESGATAARRELELNNTDEALRSLKQQIWAAQDARVAAEEAARMQAEAAEAARRAAEEQARAQKELRDGWQRVADSIWDTMRRLRGDILGPEQTFARAQSEFAIATAQARAGNQDAAGQLPTLAQAVVELGKSQASTAVEQALLTARTLASLDRTVQGLAQTFGLEVPAYAAGSSFIPRDTLALVHEGERIIPAADNRALIQALGSGDIAAELRALRAEGALLRAEVALLRQANSAENSAIANHARTAADVLDSSARGGRSLYTRTTA
jgi:hypothetical protein